MLQLFEVNTHLESVVGLCAFDSLLVNAYERLLKPINWRIERRRGLVLMHSFEDDSCHKGLPLPLIVPCV